jgi:hypothetical protein
MQHWIKTNKIFASLIVVALLGGIAIAWFFNTPLQGDGVAQKAQQINAFTPYYFKNGLPNGFAVIQEGSQYANGVFIFQIKNKDGQKMVITQQATTQDTGGVPQGSEKVDGVSGNGAISFSNGQVIGVLVTDKNTLVLLTAPSGVGSEAIKDIMHSLAPAK